METDIALADVAHLLRVYAPSELGRDGYPPEWHATVKHAVRAEAGHRCIRCRHPHIVKKEPWGISSPSAHQRRDPRTGKYVNVSVCDDECRHGGPVLYWTPTTGWGRYDGPDETIAAEVYAIWRILTVHHLTGDKADCRWWNLAALCQRCHLTIQGRVVMNRAFILEHSEWMKPYAAGFYAWKYLDEELSRSETVARMDELLALERLA